MLQIVVTSPEQVLFSGSAKRAVFPGEQGTFEVLPMHRALVSRLVSGLVEIDDYRVAIRRGVALVANDEVTAVVEVAESP